MAQLSRFTKDTAAPIKRDTATRGKSIKPIHYTKLKDSKWQYCDEKDKEEIIRLAMQIDACKEILQPLLVRKTDVDEYEIIAGHKRRRAARFLVEEEGKKAYEFLPCIIQDVSEVVTEFQVYASNGFHEKTDYEKMHELSHMKALLEKYPEEFPHLSAGRMVDKLAGQMNMSRSTVGEYLQIEKNLSEDGMNAFREGSLNKSAAVELSSLSHEEQNRLLGEGITKQKDIKARKEQSILPIQSSGVETNVKDKPAGDVPKFGTSEPVPESEVLPEDVLPGQMKVVNTDMELEEELLPVTESDKTGVAEEHKCPNCKTLMRPDNTFRYFSKTYCICCLYDLLLDLEDTGVITIDRSEAMTKGNVVRS